MNWEEFARTYEIIGTTVKPADDALPLRLTPIFRQRDAPSALFMSVEKDENNDPPTLVAEDAEWLTEQIQATCDPPIKPQPGHWLMKLKPDGPPQYIGRNELSARLQAVYDEALAKAERALMSSDLASARKCLFLASRAHPALPASEPLPQLALIPLLRAQLSVEDLNFFIADIKASYQKTQLQDSLLRMRRAHQTLWKRLCADPALSLLDLDPALGFSGEPTPSSRSFLDRKARKNTILPDILTLRDFWKTPNRFPLQLAAWGD